MCTLHLLHSLSPPSIALGGAPKFGILSVYFWFAFSFFVAYCTTTLVAGLALLCGRHPTGPCCSLSPSLSRKVTTRLPKSDDDTAREWDNGGGCLPPPHTCVVYLPTCGMPLVTTTLCLALALYFGVWEQKGIPPRPYLSEII